LSRDVTFDKTSMVKPMNSQQLESEKTKRIMHQVENDTTSPSQDKTISFKITTEVTQGGDHIVDKDTDDDEDQGPVMGTVQDSIAIKRTRRYVSPLGSLQT